MKFPVRGRHYLIVLTITFTLFLLSCSALYYGEVKQTFDLTCRGEVQLMREDTVFRGIIDYKSSSEKGIVNLSGFITDPSGRRSVVQRMVLFTRGDFGVSPVFESKKIIVFNPETATMSQMKKVIPDFYLEKDAISDVDIFPAEGDAWLITKSNIPYLYCKEYAL